LRTFELGVYTLRTKRPFISTGKWSIHAISTAFRYLGSRRTAFGRPRRMSSHGSTCWSPTTQARNPARSVGGPCKAPNSLTTPETSMSPTSLALIQRFSYLQQTPRSRDGEEKANKNDEHDSRLRQFDVEKEFAAVLVHPRGASCDHRNRHQLHTQPGRGLRCLRHSHPRPRHLSLHEDQGNSRHLCGSGSPAIPLEGRPAHNRDALRHFNLRPFGDGLVILRHLGFAPPIYIHWGTALYMTIVAVFLLRKPTT